MKKSLIYLIAAYIFALLTIPSSWAAPFAVTNENNLSISWQGRPLIRSERFSALAPNGFAKCQKRSEEIAKHTVINHFGDKNGTAFRREIAIKDGGKEVEISFQTSIPAYSEEADNKPKIYSLIFDFDDFINWRYTAKIDSIAHTNSISGTIKPSTPDGDLLPGRTQNNRSIRQIALQSPDGKKKLVIDCSPFGCNDFYGDTASNSVLSLWNIVRRGEKLYIEMSFTPSIYGGTNTGKVQIYEGTAEDYERRHSLVRNRFFSEIPPEQQISISSEFGEMYWGVDVQPFNNYRNAGWLNPQGFKRLSTSRTSSYGTWYNGVHSSTANTFRIGNMRNGLHLLTFLIPGYHQVLDGMNIAVDGKTRVNKFVINPHTANIITLPVWVTKGSTDITFSGNWQLAAINDQLLMTTAEDFSFNRGFWLSTKGPHPSPLFHSSSVHTPPLYNVSISTYPMPEPGFEMNNTREELQFPQAKAEFADGEDWRYAAVFGEWLPGGNSSFAEFTQPETIDRRLNELQSDKVDTVILNGLYQRHNYPAHQQRLEKIIALIVESGHARNMKFIERLDFSTIWQSEGGYRAMTERINQIQHTINCALPAPGYCLNNPQTRNFFFDYITNHVKQTNIDGLMIDEISFQSDNFCGCAWCRKKFTQDTNWQLPADEKSPHLYNSNSPLWRVWLQWRQKSIADFWADLRSEIQKQQSEKPMLMLVHTPHLSLYSNYLSQGTGISLGPLSKVADFLGTEIMSRNSFASYRSVACLRKMSNMYKNVNNMPVFGLLNNDSSNWDISYFGWALNNLNAQITLEINSIPCPVGKNNYRIFNQSSDNMDKFTAQSSARIALYYPGWSRDFGKITPPLQHCEKHFTANRATAEQSPGNTANVQHHHHHAANNLPIMDTMGFSQVMTARHIPHEFISEDGLTEEVLKRYKVIFINNAIALSESEIDKLVNYVRKGGIIYISSRVANYDELGLKNKTWLAGQYLLNGSKFAASARPQRIRSIINVLNRQKMDCHIKSKHNLKPLALHAYDLSPQLETIWAADTGRRSAPRTPVLVRNRIGLGAVYFSPVAFGNNSAAFEVTSLHPMDFEQLPLADNIVYNLIKTVAGENFVWKTSGIPERVITSLYQLGDGRLAVHFLNATDSRYNIEDEIAQDLAPDVFSPLRTEMSFTIKHPGSKVYAVSPDFNNRRITLPSKRMGDYIKVTIPRNTLKAYMIVYVE